MFDNVRVLRTYTTEVSMVFKWVWSYIKQYVGFMIFGLLLAVCTSAMSMVAPYLSGIIVDEVIQGGRRELLIPFIGLIIGITFIRSIVRYSFQLVFEYVSQNSMFKMREDIYNNIQKMDFDFFDRTRTGDIMARMTGDMDAVRHFIAWVIYMVFENMLIFIFAVATMFSINHRLALILVAFTPPIAYFARRLTFEVKPTFSNIRMQFSKLNTVVQENISGNRVVKAFAKEDYEIEKFDKENEQFKKANLDSAKIWCKYLPVLDSLSGSLSVVMLIAGGFLVMQEALSLGELVTFNSLIFALSNPLRMAGWLINDIQRFSASAEKIIELVNEEPKIKSEEFAVRKEHINGAIEFRNVNFRYADEPVIKDVNLFIKHGETVGIIGPTGSGKSTLMNLLCRFYDCTSGEILIDGIDIKKINLERLRLNVAVAMQDIFLFSDTIEGNIAYGMPNASIEEVKWAAKLAGAHQFIKKFPEGYNTIVGERGVGLSGGQRQRIALARALLKNPSILILDDTTSSVDMETEHSIQKSLNSINKDKTTFIIAHRISSVKNADTIIVLEDGQVVEQGTHEELLAKKQHYYNVYLTQFGDFDGVSSKEVV
jgi:ATP-binding cassette, subfamily B, multidrug efflux pump